MARIARAIFLQPIVAHKILKQRLIRIQSFFFKEEGQAKEMMHPW